MDPRIRSFVVSGVVSVGVAIAVAIGITGRATPADGAPFVPLQTAAVGPGDTPSSTPIATLLRDKEPVAVSTYLARLNARPGPGIVYTPFMQAAIHDYLVTKAPPANPAIGFLRAEATNAVATLTEDDVTKACLAKVKVLTGALAPTNLKDQIKARNNNNVAANAGPAQALVALAGGAANLPNPGQDRLDWRDKGLVVQNTGIVTGPQDQKTCGCCWAFASVAAVEAAYALDNKDLIGGSEQYVLNNAAKTGIFPYPYSCNGGWWVFDMLLAAPKQKINPPGLPSRNDLPYSGQPSTNGALNLPYTLQDWGYVNVSGPSTIPTNPDLKQALCDKGPLAVAVMVTNDETNSAQWVGNHGEVLGDFANDPTMPKPINHVVLLVGWNDSIVAPDGSKGAWIFKNSWGAWGMPIPATNQGSGFGYIKYNSNNFGMGAAWVVPSP